MKIAVCLYGNVGFKEKLGGSDGNNLIPLPLEELYKSIKEFILDDNDCDIFIHSWSEDRREEIINLYEPKKYVIEAQKNFALSRKSKKHATLSRWYSECKSNELKKNYEIENGFLYDIVLHTRFDLKWFSKIDFKQIEKNTFYVSHWNESINKNKLGPYNKSNVYVNYAFMDLWFYSGSKIMDKFSKIYKFRYMLYFLNYFRYNNHRFSYITTKLNKFNIQFNLYRGHDYEIYRRYARKDWKQS